MNDYCERAIAAMSTTPDGADAELQRRMVVVLQHLHAIIDEIKPTDKELYAAMDWLNQVGRDSDFIMLCDVLGLTMRAVELTYARPGATAANVEGPFAKDDVPVFENPVNFAAPDEAGQRIELCGTVRAAGSGGSIAGALFEIWQTNHAGKYENEDPSQPRDNFRGRFFTAADGSYSISTVVPGAYEIGQLHSAVGTLMIKLGRKRLRAPHLHYRLSKAGFQPLTSQIYFDGQPENPTDCVFSANPDITVKLEPHAKREGHLLAEYDIRLTERRDAE